MSTTKTTLDRFEDDYAILKCNDGSEACLPISIMPEAEEGESIHLDISSQKETIEDQDPYVLLNTILKG